MHKTQVTLTWVERQQSKVAWCLDTTVWLTTLVAQSSYYEDLGLHHSTKTIDSFSQAQNHFSGVRITSIGDIFCLWCSDKITDFDQSDIPVLTQQFLEQQSKPVPLHRISPFPDATDHRVCFYH